MDTQAGKYLYKKGRTTLFHLFLVFSIDETVFKQINVKNTFAQYPVPGFELTTFQSLEVSSYLKTLTVTDALLLKIIVF